MIIIFHDWFLHIKMFLRSFKTMEQCFGVYWDYMLNPRCLYCKGKLKETVDSSILSCYDCCSGEGNVHALRRTDGIFISKQEAQLVLSQKRNCEFIRESRRK